MITETDNLITGLYGSMDVFLESVADPKARSQDNQSELSECVNASHGMDADWYGLPKKSDCSVKAITKLFRDGWADGAKRVQDMADSLPPYKLPDIRRRLVWGDTGDTVDMDRVRNGQLDRAFRRPHRNGKGVPRIAIIIDISGNCDVKAEELFWRGAAGNCLALALVRAGYAVEIIAANSTSPTHNSKTMLCAVTVKPYASPFTLPDLAAAVSPAMFRSPGIAWIYKYSNAHNPGAGCHKSVNDHAKHLQGVTRAHYMAMVTDGVSNQDRAQKWIERHIRAIQALKLDGAAVTIAA